MSGVRQQVVARDEDGMRLDRWFATHFPQVTFGHLQKLLRSGQIRIDSGRAKSSTRLVSGQVVRVPPVAPAAEVAEHKVNSRDAEFLRELILYEDDDLYVFNKPHGLASQGGSGQTRHLDGLLKNLPNAKGEPPRLVHRLDRDTSGCLVVAKTKAAAAHFGTVFSSRSARKIYWAVVAGVPSPKQGRISCFLAKQGTGDGEQMVVVEQGTENAVHSMSHYAVIDTAGPDFAWVSLKPVTGRTHQLRVHMMELGTPILDDPRYFKHENWNWVRPDALGQGLHLHARRISLPLRGGKRLDVSAPLPPHMAQTFDALGFDASRFDASEIPRMREFLDEAHQHRDDGYGRVQKADKRELPKRLYKTAGVAPAEGGFAVTLDGKPALTPGRLPVVVPVAGIATAMAEEWAAQGERVDPSTMPMVRLVNAAIESGEAKVPSLRAEIVRYAGNDLLLYRADGPAALVEAQEKLWDAALVKLARHFEVAFQPTVGIVHQPQPPATLARIAEALEGEGLFILVALNVITTITGSGLLAIAVRERLLSPDLVWETAHVDEDFQAGQWGAVDEAVARRARRRAEYDAAVALVELMRAD